jgi:predicted nucleotidyltransferase
LGGRSLAQFRSAARDEASDIDLLVEFSRPAGSFARVEVTKFVYKGA